jgi:hypothetical protein
VFPGFGCQVKEIRRDGRGGITSERGEFDRPALHKKESKEKGSRDSKAQQWVMGGKEREEQENPVRQREGEETEDMELEQRRGQGCGGPRGWGGRSRRV